MVQSVWDLIEIEEDLDKALNDGDVADTIEASVIDSSHVPNCISEIHIKTEPGPLLPFPSLPSFHSLCHVFCISKIQDGCQNKYSVQRVGGGAAVGGGV